MRSDEETAPKANVLPFRSRKSTYETLYTERKDKFRISVLDLVDETIRHGGLHPADFADAALRLCQLRLHCDARVEPEERVRRIRYACSRDRSECPRGNRQTPSRGKRSAARTNVVRLAVDEFALAMSTFAPSSI